MSDPHKDIKNFTGTTPENVAEKISNFLKNPNRGGFADASPKTWIVLAESLKFHPEAPWGSQWTQTVVRLK